MLTPKQNLKECMKGIENGGKPEHFANQWDAIVPIFTPVMNHWNKPMPGEMGKVNCWGVTESWAPGEPGAFPDHSPDKIVIQDIEEWQDYVHAPTLEFPEAEWDEVYAKQVEPIDRDSYYVAPFVAPGLWEMCHYLMKIDNAMVALYENPDEMHELIKFLTDWELKLAEVTCDHIHPDAMFHHDDWGTQKSLMMKPKMFEDFFLEPYKLIYGYWHERGVEKIFHHSDSYAEPLVPDMIEMGIDVWQGVMTTNDIPAMIKKYGDKITFMGGINSATIDFEGSTYDVVLEQARRACNEYGPSHMIIGASQGLPLATFPNVYEWTTQAIDQASKEYWEAHNLPTEGEVTC